MEPGRKLVLFVDDEPSILSALRRALLMERYEVATAEGGAEALKLIEKVEPAVVVSDMRMPGMNGVELLSRVAARCPRTVRIILTGYSDQGTVDGAIRRGEVYRCVMKPCRNDDLKLVLEEALKRYEQAAPQA